MSKSVFVFLVSFVLVLSVIGFSSFSHGLSVGSGIGIKLNASDTSNYSSDQNTNSNSNNGNSNQNSNDNSDDSPNIASSSGNSNDNSDAQADIQTGSGDEQDSQVLSSNIFITGDEDSQEINFDNIKVKTRLNVSIETDENANSKVSAELSNGQNAEVKIMPNEASSIAISKLKAKCNGNCSIELKETGSGNEAKLAYEVHAVKDAKVIGLFSTEMDVSAYINADTGEIISINKPWWSFAATEKDELN